MRGLRRRRAVWCLAVVSSLALAATSCEKKNDDDGEAPSATPTTSPSETSASAAGDDDGDETGAAPLEDTPGQGAAGAQAQGDLQATLDGKALTFADALAYPLTTDARGWHVEVSTHAMTCSTESGYRYRDGEVRFSFDVTPSLERDGTMPMRVHKTYFDGMNVQGNQIEADLKRVEAGDEVVELELGAFTVQAMRDDPPIELSGTVAARRCPEPRARGGKVAAPSPTDLVLVVAGQRFPIQGATVELDAEKQTRTLRLSTEPHDCEVWPGDTLALDARLGPDDRIAHLFLRGDVMSTQLNDSTQIENLTATVPPLGELTGDTAEVGLSGSHTLLDYTIEVEGSKATARVCRE